MRLVVLAVGKLKNKYWKSLAEDYSTRIKRRAKLELIEIRDADPVKEGEKLLSSLEALEPDHRFIFTEEGKERTSLEWAGTLKQYPSGTLAFVIGGAYGLSDTVKSSGELVALSAMTFTHEMARIILLEQLYRALSINAGSGYHH